MKYEIRVIRIDETDWDIHRNLCWPLFYTDAVSEAQAINNVRFRVRKEYGWKDYDHGSLSVRYEFQAKLVEEHGYEQLKLFD